LAEDLPEFSAVRHQPTGFHKGTKRVNGGQSVFGSEFYDELPF
jgi:hypothetical protein